MQHYKKGCPRKNRSKRDKGTVELQQKRKALVHQENGQKLRLAESLLGVLYARDQLSKPLYEAGCFFGELGYRYEACLGEVSRKRYNILTRREGRSLLSEEKDERDTKAWRMALGALKEAGQRPFQAVLKVVFHDQDLYTNGLPQVPFEALRQGLASLDLYFKSEASKDESHTPHDQVGNPGQSTTFPRLLKEGPPQVLP